MTSNNLKNFQNILPGKYQLTRELGTGGQGKVFLCKKNGVDIALKLFDPRSNPRRIERELQLLRDVNCKNLISIYDWCNITINNINIILVEYEYIPGGDLTQFLEPNSPQLTNNELLIIGVNVARAINTLWNWHRSRVVHRDVKPHNILLHSQAHYILADLGLARHIDLSDLTAMGGAPGTSGYMSPEQALGRKNLTYKSDIFSLGVSLYELASKIHPFQRNQSVIGHKQPVPLENYRKDLTNHFVKLIHQMMHVIPAYRPNNVVERIGGLIGG